MDGDGRGWAGEGACGVARGWCSVVQWRHGERIGAAAGVGVGDATDGNGDGRIVGGVMASGMRGVSQCVGSGGRGRAGGRGGVAAGAECTRVAGDGARVCAGSGPCRVAGAGRGISAGIEQGGDGCDCVRGCGRAAQRGAASVMDAGGSAGDAVDWRAVLSVQQCAVYGMFGGVCERVAVLRGDSAAECGGGGRSGAKGGSGWR